MTKVAKLKELLNSLENETDAQVLGLRENYKRLFDCTLAMTPAQVERNVVSVAFFLQETYNFARKKVKGFSENETTLVDNEKKLYNFFIKSAPRPISFFLKKIDSQHLNAKVMTEKFFLKLAREMLGAKKIGGIEKRVKPKETKLPTDHNSHNLSILKQLETIVYLSENELAIQHLDEFKYIIEKLMLARKAGSFQNALEAYRLELLKKLDDLFKIAQHDKQLQAVCAIFEDFADIGKQACVSNCVKSPLIPSKEISLSLAKVILQEEGIFYARSIESDVQPEFRFSRYQQTFSPVQQDNERISVVSSESSASNFSNTLFSR